MCLLNYFQHFTVVGYYGAFPLFVIARELDLVGNVAPVAVVEEFTRFGFALQVAVDVFDEQVRSSSVQRSKSCRAISTE